ncbi:MAG: transposase [Hyphomicrobiales bacterium]|nr:transposase [Hyphomicrobiales bacterium]
MTDADRELIEALLHPERGGKSRPAQDNRRFLNGMLHVLRVGCTWRDLHEGDGKWNPVYARFRLIADVRSEGSERPFEVLISVIPHRSECALSETH